MGEPARREEAQAGIGRWLYLSTSSAGEIRLFFFKVTNGGKGLERNRVGVGCSWSRNCLRASSYEFVGMDVAVLSARWYLLALYLYYIGKRTRRIIELV